MSVRKQFDKVVAEATRINPQAGARLQNVVAIRFGKGVDLIETGDGSEVDSTPSSVGNAIALACYRLLKPSELCHNKIVPVKDVVATTRFVERYQLDRTELRRNYEAYQDLGSVKSKLKKDTGYCIDLVLPVECDGAAEAERLHGKRFSRTQLSGSSDSLGGIDVVRGFAFAMPELSSLVELEARSGRDELADICDSLCEHSERLSPQRVVELTFGT